MDPPSIGEAAKSCGVFFDCPFEGRADSGVGEAGLGGAAVSPLAFGLAVAAGFDATFAAGFGAGFGAGFDAALDFGFGAGFLADGFGADAAFWGFTDFAAFGATFFAACGAAFFA